MRTSPDRRLVAPRPRTLAVLLLTSSLGACSMFHFGQKPGTTPDYTAAIAQYRDYLKTYPDDPHNDRVIYQLARAQEQGGQLEQALATLDSLVARYPQTRYRDEAQFRRGELLFTLRQYPKAE